ncbi:MULTISPECIES: GFA family protein [unclassified Sphingopyxis]|uniref:GFA family protein n=1 Tax=unclassified Sphingopyxis TaxID=2614943 RepID=UPI0009EB9830|nr:MULTISPECIES: GFA family protein [unclassified Sphingopyxis]
MTREAACHCRAVRLECTGEPAKISLCNCLDCQRRTGSLFSVAAFFPRGSVRQMSGDCGTFRRDSASGFPVTFHFCRKRGTSLWWEAERLPHLVGIAAGTFEDPAFPAPAQAVWTKDRHHWLAFPDTVPCSRENPAPRP